jgi:trk system potassium uptake protein TrkA
MYVIIGGAGDAGRHLGNVLAKEGHEVALIDKDPNAIEKAREIDALVIKGDVLDFKTLLDAGITNCDFYIGLVKEDSENLVSCSLANFYNTKTIARIKSPSLAKEALSRRYTPIGVDIVLCPSLLVSSQISRLFSFPARIKKVKKHRIGTYHTTIDTDSKSVGKDISSLDLPRGVRIVSVFRGVSQFLPAESLVLQPQDELCLFMDERVKLIEVAKILDCNIFSYNIVKNVFIASATDVGLTLSQELLNCGISVSIMELTKKRAEKAAKKLRKATVIHGDPLGHGVLRKEGIENFDVLLSLGGNLERNIFISILAKKFNVPKAITLIDRIDLKESIEGTLIDNAVVPNLLLIKTILNIMKEKHEINGRSRKRRTLKVRSLQTKDIVLKQIKVNKKMRCINKKIGTFSPESGNFLIPCISKKDEKGFVPQDDYIIKEGDKIFVLYHSGDEKSVKRWLIG